MWVQRSPSTLVFLTLASLQTVSISSPVLDGTRMYASEGDSVTLPCFMDSPKNTRVVKFSGQWTWRASASDVVPSVILQYISSSIPSKGKLGMSSRSLVSSRRSFGNFSLSIKNIEPRDAGVFECDFQFTHYKARATLELVIITVTSNSSRPSLQGDYVAMNCLAPAGSVSWMGPGYSGRKQENPMVLRGVGARHAGRWTCQVALGKGNITASHTLDVIGFSASAAETIYLPLGFSTLLPCSLTRFPTSSGVSGGWRRGGTELVRMNVSRGGWMWPEGAASPLRTPVNPPSTNLSVTLRANSLSEGGSYQCHLCLHNREISSSVRVSVIQVNSTPAGDILVGSNVTLICKLSHHDEDTQVDWHQMNSTRESPKVLKLSTRTFTLIVRLTEVTYQDAGEWGCQISRNAVKLGEAKLTLNIKDVPHTLFGTVNIILMTAIPASVLLLILISTLIGVCLAKRARRRRRALRRLRHPLCREHSNQLSNQPLCQGNDYISTEYPLPPLPPYCPHQPQKGRRSQGRAHRQAPRGQYVART